MHLFWSIFQMKKQRNSLRELFHSKYQSKTVAFVFIGVILVFLSVFSMTDMLIPKIIYKASNMLSMMMHMLESYLRCDY